MKSLPKLNRLLAKLISWQTLTPSKEGRRKGRGVEACQAGRGAGSPGNLPPVNYPDGVRARDIHSYGQSIPGHELSCGCKLLGWGGLGKSRHIYFLELVAATLALKTFIKDKRGVLVLLRLDNTTAVAYIRNHGGTLSRDTSLPDSRSVDVVPGKEHPHPSTTITRGAESHSRLGIKIHERSVGLEAGPTNLSENRRVLWPTRSGPICIQANQLVMSLLQLAARSICRSNRCLLPGLDIHEGVCQSSMEPDIPGPDKSTNAKGRYGSSSSGMESTTLVCSPFINVSGLDMPSFPEKQSQGHCH